MGSLIKDLLKEERPREKAKKYGVESLSNIELLALLFRTGKKNESVIDLSRKVLNQFDDLENIENLRDASLKSLSGIGEVKSLTLLAALELGKRVYLKKEKDSVVFNNSKSIYLYYQPFFIHEAQEKFVCLFLNNRNNLIKDKVLFMGSATRSIVSAKEVFREALLNNASKIVCVHNHPSGNPRPSKEDYLITQKLYEIGDILGIKVVDHIIMGKNSYYSFLEHEEVF